jgi:hypothetical protein
MWVEMVESVGVLAVLKDWRIFVVNVGNLDMVLDHLHKSKNSTYSKIVLCFLLNVGTTNGATFNLISETCVSKHILI